MKYLVIILVCFSCCGTKGTQEKQVNNGTPTSGSSDEGSTVNTNKPDTTELVKPPFTGKQIAVSFGSLASGPIGDDFLKTWLQKFIREEKVAVTAEKFSGCGKEGEYIIVISKTNFSNAMDEKFSSGLEKLVADEIKRTKAISSSSGSVNITYNPDISEYSYCRLGSKKWI
jgi:hypothetical protein